MHSLKILFDIEFTLQNKFSFIYKYEHYFFNFMKHTCPQLNDYYRKISELVMEPFKNLIQI